MKLSELDKNKEYFIYNREHWIDAGYGDTYFKTAQDLRHYRYRLVTDTEGNLRRNGSQVLVISPNSTRSEWATLKSIRAPFFDAVELITKNRRNRRNRWNDIGVRYAMHLQRKADHERKQVEKPIKEEFQQALKQLGADVWSQSRVLDLPVGVMQTITEALKQYPNNESKEA